MSYAETYGPYVPYLRRFARALTGSQTDGDQYVKIALEALAAGETDIDDEIDAKVALFQMFLGIWRTTGAELETEPEVANLDSQKTPHDRVRALAPTSRLAFLLSAMEGMNNSEIAQVMRVNVDEVKDLIDTAEMDISRQLETKVMIIEDEPIIAVDLEGLVEELGHKSTGIAATHTTAVELFHEDRPGLVLADVQLADGSSGIEAVSEILESYDVPVIFITAFPERLLTGEGLEPTYLIAKPFKPSNVKAAISQALLFHRSAS